MARNKKQKGLKYDGEDIISNLPDGILSEDIISNLPDDIRSHILSFLPTKEAARTSLLSKRWGKLWTFIPRLEFHDESRYKCHARRTETPKFLELVNRILQQQISTSSIHSLTLFSPNTLVQYPSEDLNALICHVLEKKVQKFSINQINEKYRYRSRGVSIFPCAIFDSRSLIELDISMPSSLRIPTYNGLRIPTYNCLTNLQVLKFCGIVFSRDCFSSSKELTLNFPVLKVFEIAHCTFLDMNVLIIDTPMLESFAIRVLQFKDSSGNVRSIVYGTIRLLAFGLRRFSYCGNLGEDIILRNPLTVGDVFRNVRRTNFDREHETCAKACMLLKEFKSVEFLELGPFMTETLEYLRDDDSLPIFKRLDSLVLAFSELSLLDVLSKLLQKSPKLQRLELNNAISNSGVWSSEYVPPCSWCNIKVVKFAVCDWDEDKFQFTKYVLENAPVLDQLTISVKAGVRKVEKELRSIPESISSAQINVRSVTKMDREFRDKYIVRMF